VFSRRQVTSSRRQGPHHVTVESDQKGPKKMNGFSNNCMGTGISQETRLPHLKAPGKPEQSNNQGLHRSAHVFAEGPLRLFGASPPENLSKTMSESFFGQPPICFCHYSMEIYKYISHKKEKNRHKSHTRKKQKQKKNRNMAKNCPPCYVETTKNKSLRQKNQIRISKGLRGHGYRALRNLGWIRVGDTQVGCMMTPKI